MGRSMRGAMGAFKHNRERMEENRRLEAVGRQQANIVLVGIAIFSFGLLAITLYI